MSTSNHYEIQTLCGNNYENTWNDDGEPTVFATEDEARTAYAEFISEMRDAVAEGNIQDMPEDGDLALVCLTPNGETVSREPLDVPDDAPRPKF